MRRSALLLVGLLTAAQLSGCTPGETPIEDRPENLTVAVFLDPEATASQTSAVETRLRAVPDITDLTFVDHQQAYEAMRKDLADEPDLLDSVKPESLPESFRFRLPDRAAFEHTYSGPLRADLRALDGVDSVVFRGKKIQESVKDCVVDYGGRVATHVVLDVDVFLTDGASAREKQAIEARLRAVPGASGVRLRSREEGYERLKEMYQDIKPEIVASAKPADLPEVLVLTLADRPAVVRANDEKLAEQVCRLPGVDHVLVPPKSLARKATS
ncbi:permease-like cell division protein FtsX [Micromonospora sp. CPCC 205556]|uniref:permease-like cell division protein FtsX n=1 Tax=Micromonospora sp. CPCC 205556 TaxID=3122398 RepID=UPI002FF21A06